MRWTILFAIIFFSLSFTKVHALECEGKPPIGDVNQITEYINACTRKIDTLKNQQGTLKQAITAINSQINLTQGQINRTTTQIELVEKDISILSGVLDTVNISMSDLAKIYSARVRESYLRYRSDPSNLIFSNTSFADYFNKLKYLNVIKSKDQLILTELEKSRLEYDAKKKTKVDKQLELEKLQKDLLGQKKNLDNDQKVKANLLVVTQNDEKRYQSLLSKARAELEAIEAVIAGRGKEEEVGDVKVGDVIAKIINDKSCNSDGAHLHFIVSQDRTVKNPFDYLKTIDSRNCSGLVCEQGERDPFDPRGSWDWPLSPKISFSQGFGVTWAVRNTWVGKIYKFHNGIDIYSSDLNVRAVKDGKLYRGSYSGQNSCALKYVRLHHRDGNLDTYYLHVNYF